MTAILISASHLERLAHDHDRIIELAPSEGRAYMEHDGVTYCALLGVSA